MSASDPVIPWSHLTDGGFAPLSRHCTLSWLAKAHAATGSTVAATYMWRLLQDHLAGQAAA